MLRTGLDAVTSSPITTLIIGSGPAGITLALELERLGQSCTLLESGREQQGPAQALAAADIVDPKRHDDMAIAVARRLGGTSNLWGGRSMPMDPADFEPRPFALNTRWPMDYADLARFYPTACTYTHCGEPVFQWAMSGVDVVSNDFSFDSIERASNKPRFQVSHASKLAASDQIDIRLGVTVVDFLFGEVGNLTGVVAVGPDARRVEIPAKRVVIAAGGLETTRLLLFIQRKRPHIFGGPEGPLGRYYMGHIIGEIADIVFADKTFDLAFDFALDGHGSYTRRRFVPSLDLQRSERLPNVCFWPVVPPVADQRHRSGPLSTVAMGLSTPVLGAMLIPEAIRTRHVPERIDWLPHLRNVLGDLPGTATFLGGFIWKRYLASQRIPGYFVRNQARRYGLSYHSEQSPRADSRVVLTDSTDPLGLPRLRIDLRFHRDDAEGLARAHDRLGAWLQASGIARLEYRQDPSANVDRILELASHGTHQIGTVRMGFSAKDGVVDRDLRTFDLPNLFVVSSAVFPTSSQANPTLTIVALAARLAATLAADQAPALIPSP